MPDVRPIDADALVNYKVSGVIGDLSGDFIPGYAIGNAPTLDYAPVRHGEWGKPEIVGYDGIRAIYAAPCSLCGKHTKEYKPRYCPNCGAKMDGGTE